MVKDESTCSSKKYGIDLSHTAWLPQLTITIYVYTMRHMDMVVMTTTSHDTWLLS